MSHDPSRRKTSGTRAGLPLDISARDLKRILSTSNDNFQEYAKDKYISPEALYYKTGFYSPKWNSISKRTDEEKIQKYRSLNYSGYWKESGWIDYKSVGIDESSVYISKPRAFCDKNTLPYTVTGNSTGVFVNLKWSGLQDYYDNDKYCVAGILKKGVYEKRRNDPDSYIAPYRNVFEIFDHSGFQKLDISNHRFYLESGYQEGQPIGYNKIYYQSGLHPSGIINYSFLFIPNRRISDYDIRLGDVGKNFIPSSDPLNEPHNVVRYNIFFYTGELPLVQITGGNNQIKRGFGFGPVYQHTNTNYKNLVNQNYRMQFTGIYGESAVKEFSIFNTGNITERFYIGIDEPNILSIDEDLVPGLPKYGVWTYENQSGKNYGQMINKIYKVGRHSNINFKVKIESFACPKDVKRTANINIYRITGGHQAFNNNFPNAVFNSGYMSQKHVLPIDIYVKNNQTVIQNDSFFYQNIASGDFKPISKVGEVLSVDPDDQFNNFNMKKQVGITFYSLGENLKDLRVTLDTRSKIKRKGIIHPDDVKTTQEEDQQA